MRTTPFDRGRRAVRTALPLLALLGAAACASAGASGGWEVGRQWGCDPEEVRREHAEARPAGSDPLSIPPRQGWSACQLLALHGPPDEVRRVESESGDTYHLYYRSDGDTRMLTLRRDVTGSWRVSAVVW